MKPFSRNLIIFAPYGRDASTIESLLQPRNISTTIVTSFKELVDELDTYVGAVILTDESLTGESLDSLAYKLDDQPSWSDVPFVLLTQRSRMDGVQQKRLAGRLPARMNNIIYVERPASALSLTSAVEAALSGRERQFQIRDELRAAAELNERLREAEATLARSHQDLERRVVQRTIALREANARLQEEIEERRRAEESLAHAQKLEAVGRLTGGIAHDFNNLLMALVGNLELARHQLGSDHVVTPLLDNMHKAAERGTKLSTQLLAFSRIQTLTLQPVAVDALLDEVIGLARHSLGAFHTIETQLHATDLFVVADFNQIELAILNLINNARDAMDGGGIVTLSAQRRTVDAMDIELSSGTYVEISVIDTGCGISADALPRIFDPFYTTKPVGKGTGLGLAQVWGITHQCGGTVRVTTEEGKGTQISLWLPAASQKAAERLPASAAPEKARHEHRRSEGITVLVIDDDDNVRDSLVAGLTLDNFEVQEARSGKDGLALVTADFPSVLVVDFAMPTMNGADVARAAQKIRPDLPVLMVTGYSDTAALDGVANAQVLRKPFPLAELGKRIIALSDEAATRKP